MKHRHCQVPVRYITRGGVKLGTIVERIKKEKVEFTEDEKTHLNELNFFSKKG